METPEPPVVESSTVNRRAVALELEQLRLAAGLERKDVAKALGCAPSKIGHLETMRNQPSRPDLMVMLELYKRPDRLAVLWERTQRGRERGFWENHDGAIGPEGFELYVGQEFGASELLVWDALAINGLLQVPEYATALMKNYGTIDDVDIAQRLDLRMQRQQILDRAHPPRLHVIVDEGVLRRLVGGSAVMRKQINRLIDLSERPNITLQVLLASAGAHPGQHGPFTILRFPFDHDPGSVYIETRVHSFWREEPEEITEYGDIFQHLSTLATKPERVKAVLAQIKKELPE